VDDRGIEDRPLLQQGALIFKRLLDRLENLLADSVLLEQMTKIQNRGLIWNPLRDHVDPHKAPETGGVDQHLLHQRIRQREPLLQQVNAQHHLQRKRRPASLGRWLVVNRTDQCMEVIPGDRRFHLVEEDLPPRLLLGVDLLVIAEPQLK
jgi:hypothetical protein